MSRSVASPEAETRSYSPPPPWRISATISSEEPAYLRFNWQPLSVSKGGRTRPGDGQGGALTVRR